MYACMLGVLPGGSQHDILFCIVLFRSDVLPAGYANQPRPVSGTSGKAVWAGGRQARCRGI